MKQIVQNYKSGKIALEEMPAPAVSDVGVLVRSTRSAVSPGTERMIIDLAQKSLLGKAAARPDLVKQVLAKVKTEGLWATFQKVQTKLDTPIPLGYSSTGKVIETGAHVESLHVGDRVACGGAGYANHAEFNHVPRNLCVKIPEGVSDEEASFSTIGAIALQGVRQAELKLGDRVAVIGLGLIGQITCQLVKASGCMCLGSDIDPAKLELAKKLGADEAVDGGDLVKAAESFSQGLGVDVVIIAASDKSSKLVQVAAEIARMKAKVVVVGLVGMDIPRDLYYKKELEIRLSMSYGPGRYDPIYEEGGIDYPFAHVRWTEGRNMEAFLDLLACGKMQIAPLITHRTPFEKILEIYEMMLSGSEPYLGVVVEYGEEEKEEPRTMVLETVKQKAVHLGMIGAGNFAKGVLLPALSKQNDVVLDTVCTQTGMSCKSVAQQFSFGACTTDAKEVFANDRINAVMVATRHDLHAEMVVQAVQSGKSVFTEKPLAILAEDLDRIEQAVRAKEDAGSTPVVMVGFNRRYSPHAKRLRECFKKRANPLVMHYRVNAGYIPPESWVQDPAVGGGRILGEACHFVDTLRFIAGAPIKRVFAESISPSTQTVLASDNLLVSLRFGDGSVGSILYSALGDSSVSKEHLEVYGDRKTGILEDYRDLVLHDKGKAGKLISGTQDKGHRKEMEVFTHAVMGKQPVDFWEMAEVTRATFAIVESLRIGKPVDFEI